MPLRALRHATADKEALALQLAAARACTSGRVAVISAVESCLTYRLRKRPNGWFAEGFDTKDLKEARALLEELAG